MPLNIPTVPRIIFGMMAITLPLGGEDAGNVGVQMLPVHQVYSSPFFFRHSAIGTENFFSISVR